MIYTSSVKMIWNHKKFCQKGEKRIWDHSSFYVIKIQELIPIFAL